jgi:hypothetical protein
MTEIDKQLAEQRRVSTDPNWCKPPKDLSDAIDRSVNPPPMPMDGRHRRSQASRDAILLVCRAAMQEGDFRPTMGACCKAAGRALRTGFEHFSTVEALHMEALKDDETRRSVLVLVLGGGAGYGDRVLQAIITGRG